MKAAHQMAVRRAASLITEFAAVVGELSASGDREAVTEVLRHLNETLLGVIEEQARIEGPEGGQTEIP